MARRRRMSVRSSPRAIKRGFKWDRNIIVPTALTAGTLAGVGLVELADYQGNNAVSPSGVTMRRLILDIHLRTAADQVAVATDIYWAVWVTDADIAVNSSTLQPNDGQDLTDERVLAAGVQGYIVRSATGADDGIHIHVDTKQGVKLRDSRVVFTIQVETGGGNWSMIGTMAILLQGDIT